ncbi:hypothetical protein FGL86_05645 [Pistricoccus aurantiacus]|uniref:Uncharacterized protein n=1 Tax=Pistricoccus aurantiacus TaxID=1883414 RepID=A0A5B8SQN5_9GAMM|nr:hypothetical protein [Pistricoccus aurantiacus]QEA38611.1 hypothetical protein FGL86_05645 [Pistricoccus aurantiacus]
MKHILDFQPLNVRGYQVTFETHVLALSGNHGGLTQREQKMSRALENIDAFSPAIAGFQFVIDTIDKFRRFRHVGPPVANSLKFALSEPLQPTTGYARHPFAAMMPNRIFRKNDRRDDWKTTVNGVEAGRHACLPTGIELARQEALIP